MIAGKFEEPVAMAGSGNIRVYATRGTSRPQSPLCANREQAVRFFTSNFGTRSPPASTWSKFPTDTLPANVGSGNCRHRRDPRRRQIAFAAAGQHHRPPVVGIEVSPKTLNDAWITNGMSRYGELMYVEEENGKSALKAALQDVAAGALAYDTIPLSSAGRLNPFSPEFQSMTLEKGAMIFHMLRWEIGDKAFQATSQGRLSASTQDKPMRIRRFHQSSRSAEPAAADALLRAVGRRHRRAHLHQQVRRLPPGK